MFPKEMTNWRRISMRIPSAAAKVAYFKFPNKKLCFFIEASDECETAADIYQCGRDAASDATAAMITQTAGSSSPVK
jgi:hypothetical protein